MLQKYKVIVNECGKDGWVPVDRISDTTFPGLNEVMMFLAERIDFAFMSVKGYLIGDSNSLFFFCHLSHIVTPLHHYNLIVPVCQC